MLKPLINALQILDIKISNYIEKHNRLKQRYIQGGRMSLWNEISPAWFRYHTQIETAEQFAQQVHNIMNKTMTEIGDVEHHHG